MLTCAAWLDPDDFTLCGADDFPDEATFDLVVEAANDMLYLASGRQFTGVCSDTVWPDRIGPLDRSQSVWGNAPALLADGSWWVPWWSASGSGASAIVGMFGAGAFGEGIFGGAGGIPGSLSPGCLPAVWLPNEPVLDVTEILVDGTALDAGSWRIVDDRWLIPADGGLWPSFNRWDLLSSESGTWTIEYTWGKPAPAAGILALQVFVCELGKAFKSDKSCRLPRRLTSITRENVTSIVMDTFAFLNQGKLGVYEVDAFVATHNPAGIQEPARVVSSRLLAETPRHVR